MDFSACLNAYIAELGCTAKQLSDASGVSAAAISRYRAGERLPDPDGHQIYLLAKGICDISNGEYDVQAVQDDLANCVSGISVDFATFVANMNALLYSSGISNVELSGALNFDTSYISRILAGQRRPADMKMFTTGVAQYVADICQDEQQREKIASLLGADAVNLEERSSAQSEIEEWLSTNYAPVHDPIGSFLNKLDEFDLDDFIEAIHFNEMKVPIAPLQLPTTKSYFGLKQMMECEIDFLKTAVMSKSSADVYMYSDMPLGEMSQDPVFPKKWMYGMAMLLKKGLRLRVLHDANRPLDEMMLGLEGWIPMYMTGLISPYYLETPQGDVFSHLLKVSGTAAMQGEAIAGHQREGRYILTKNRDEVRYYRKRAERLFEKARPLMEVLTDKDEGALTEYLDKASQTGGVQQRLILATLPIGALPAHVLESMIARSGLAESEQSALRSFVQASRDQLTNAFEACELVIEVPCPDALDFEKKPPILGLECMFPDFEIAYHAEEYIAHLKALRALASGHPGIRVVESERVTFRNIQILVVEGSFALVSKVKSPVIHFAISHPAMVDAFMRFSPPITE